MSLLGKIKYFFDGAEEAEESGLILSRRKFFMGAAALIIAPKIIDAHISGLGIGDITYNVEDFTDFLSPGAIELQRYHEEMLRQVKTKFELKPLIRIKDTGKSISWSIEDLGMSGPARYYEQLAIPIQNRLDKDLQRLFQKKGR